MAQKKTFMETDKNGDVTKLLQTKHLEPVERLLFKKNHASYEYNTNSFNRLIDTVIRSILMKGRYIIDEERHENKIVRNLFRFSDIEFHLPKDDSPNEKIITPTIAKTRMLTYASKMTAKVEQIMEIQDIQSKHIVTKVLYSDVIPMGKIPIMVRSAYCVTQENIAPNIKNTECELDPGCNFIIKGSEKFVTALEKLVDDRIFVFTKKKGDDDMMYFARINSKSHNIMGNITMCEMSVEKDKTIRVSIGKNIEIHIFILLRALGIETDEDIYNHIVYDLNDVDMINVVKQSLFGLNNEHITFSNGTSGVITNKAQALDYLKTKMTSRKFSDTNAQDKADQQYAALIEFLKNDFLPHIGSDENSLLRKGKFIGFMAHRLLLCYLNRDKTDNRDSYINKRVELPGELFEQLFKPSLRKMINETSKKFRKKRSGSVDGNYPNVISQILQSNTIEMTINQSLATGTWGGLGAKRKGVAQLEQRFTFAQSISYLRRITSPSMDKTNNRAISMRLVDQHCYGYIDSIETPEGQKVGMVKNLALSATVSLNMPEQIAIIKHILNNVSDDINMFDFDIPIDQYKKLVKIFINGEWIGFTDRAFKLINYLKNKRANGEIHKHVGIVYKESMNKDIREIRINTDGGRMIRPLLKVVDNELVITKEILDKINNDVYDIPNKINSLNQLLQEYPHVIEYVDVEESTNAMVAMYVSDLHENRKMSNTAISNPNLRGDSVNRYEKVYKKYTHCEFHPMLMLGSITCNIPLMEHNQSPRNYYYYSQVRQAMGIPTTNYKLLAPTNSYVLFNTCKPLVITRGSEYSNMANIPAGETAVVMISPYGGYNQEDSIVMNQSAVDRGLFRAVAYKKYEDIAKKNSSGQEEEFGIKDRSLVKLNEKEKNYNKINEKGFVPEDTKIVNGDVVIAKITQFNDKDLKTYKDESQIFKSNVDGRVDRVWHNKLVDGDGYPMIKMRIASERIPIVGDKFCCFTSETDVLTNIGWIKINEITKEHKIATLQNGDTLEYHNPLEIQKYDYTGKMYQIKSNHVDLLVTPNHRMYVGNRDGKNYTTKLAEDIYGKRVKYLKNVAKTNIKGLDQFIIPGIDELPDMILPINEWLTFFGIWISEGCLLRDRGLSFATHKPRVKEALLMACKKMNIDKDDKEDMIKNAWCMPDKRLVNYFMTYNVDAINKFLPEWTWQLNQEQCKILINGMLLGDGHTRRYDTSSTKLADDFQRLCLHAGYSTNKALKYEADAYRLIIITCQNNPLVNKNIKPDGTNRLDQWIDYNGQVYCCTVPGEGIIYVRRNGVAVWCGNSRHGQKGTIGARLRAQDMPFTENGIQPDIIINPCCIPSRMTIAQLFESVIGKAAACMGKVIDGTPFSGVNIVDIYNILKTYGFKNGGEEVMYCGITGKKMEKLIFIGLTYYLRLKHMVLDKIHSRSTGPRQLMNRQPLEGRALNGGFRFGEMERDCQIAHGNALTLRERLLSLSDPYLCALCIDCGQIATKLKQANAYYCQSCNTSNITVVETSYAVKLLKQNLMTVGMDLKLMTERKFI